MNQSEKEKAWFDAASRYIKSCQDFEFTNCMIAVPNQLKERAYADFRKQGYFVTAPFDHEELDAKSSFVMVAWDKEETERLAEVFEDMVFQ